MDSVPNSSPFSFSSSLIRFYKLITVTKGIDLNSIYVSKVAFGQIIDDE